MSGARLYSVGVRVEVIGARLLASGARHSPVGARVGWSVLEFIRLVRDFHWAYATLPNQGARVQRL